jgi:hypothetical protein
VDKRVIEALSPQWHKEDRHAHRIPADLHGVDRDSTWGFSKQDGWVQGYNYEVVVTATAHGAVWPLLASVAGASATEHTTFGNKTGRLPHATRYVTADSGYDNNVYGEAARNVPPSCRFFRKRDAIVWSTDENPPGLPRPSPAAGALTQEQWT